MSELSNFHTNNVKLPWANAPDLKRQTRAAWLCSSPKATQQRAAGTTLGRHHYSYAFTDSCSTTKESLALQRDFPTSHFFPGWRVHVGTPTQQQNARSSIFLVLQLFFFFLPHFISNFVYQVGNEEIMKAVKVSLNESIWKSVHLLKYVNGEQTFWKNCLAIPGRNVLVSLASNNYKKKLQIQQLSTFHES